MPTLDQTVQDLAARLEAHLEEPSDDSRDLEAVTSQLQGLGRAIGKKAVSDALRALEGSRRTLLRSRQKEIANALVAALRPLGIPLESGTPSRRQRKRSAGSAPITEGSSATNTQASSSGASTPSMGEGAGSTSPSTPDADRRATR